MGYCQNCEKCGFLYDVNYFPEFCPSCYVGLPQIIKDSKEAINTTWRAILSYEKANAVPFNMALKSAKFHLKEADYLFERELEEVIEKAIGRQSTTPANSGN